MTISDFVARLEKLQKQIGPVAQIKIGKEYNRTDLFYDYFDIEVANDNVILVPSDKWEQKKTVVQLKLNSFYGEQDDET
jgi:hypothetical protein